MIGYWGEVTDIIEETYSTQLLTVKLESRKQEIKAVHYVYGEVRCRVGSRVQVNTSALDLDLGTGGYGFVMSIDQTDITHALSREANRVQEQQYQGHILKLRYSPFQTPVLSSESPESEHHHLFQQPFSLKGKRVLLGELHSMLPLIAVLLYKWQEGRKIVYLMDDQAAMYATFSEHVRYLKSKVNLTTITFGQALGGDYETVNVYTALETAHKVVQADDIIITHGPGVVGTGTQRGFSGMQLVHWLHAVHTCGGEGVIMPRIQFGDHRPRHYGLSHHTRAALQHHALIPAYIPYPQLPEKNQGDVRDGGLNKCNFAQYDKVLQQQVRCLQEKHHLRPILLDAFSAYVDEAFRWYGRPITTMGRQFADDPYFFYAIGAAFQFYRECSMVQ